MPQYIVILLQNNLHQVLLVQVLDIHHHQDCKLVRNLIVVQYNYLVVLMQLSIDEFNLCYNLTKNLHIVVVKQILHLIEHSMVLP